MDFEYKVVITHMRRVLEWKSKVFGEPVSTVIWEAPGGSGCREEGQEGVQWR